MTALPRRNPALVVAVVLMACACGRDRPRVHDYTYAPPGGAVVTHLDLDLTVDFAHRELRGTAALDFDNPGGAKKLYLDTWALVIQRVTVGNSDIEAQWVLGDSLPIVGRPLVIDIGSDTRRVTVHYHTGRDARALDWLSPTQTADGRYPFLYTQSESILARSWVPCQDHPGNRITYRARIHTPPRVMALMSANNSRSASEDGEYAFEMPQPIPTYLLALAAGSIEYRAISDRCGVYAEPGVVDDALWEFIDMERMVRTAESMYGPYRWEQFDVLVLPPSFPYGGMENPRLTFLTPVLVAGDRSLVSTVAHELAHSWSGNLVTNATWDDFWLNEGFTTYFERRIMERLYGRDVSEMHAVLGYRDLEEEVEAEGPGSRDTALRIPLDGRDPDEELGIAPYEKGYLFLRLLEETVGRERFDRFLRGYFDKFAFQTMTTEHALDYVQAQLFEGDAGAMKKLDVDAWAYRGGIPDNAPRPESHRFDAVDRQADAFLAGTPAGELDTDGWIAQEWERFLERLEDPLTADQLGDLVSTFRFSSANAEVASSWFVVVVRNRYVPEYAAIPAYLVRVGRLWLLRPIYTALAATDDGLALARESYRRARPGYHPVTRAAIDAILRWNEVER